MGLRTTVSGKLALEALEKHPEAPTKTLARLLHKERPDIFQTIKKAAARVAYYRGNGGKHNRKALAGKEHVRANQPAGYDMFADLPKPISGWEELRFRKVKGTKIGVIADVHIPFHDEKALRTALGWLRDEDIDTLILNGDIADFYAFSRWAKDPRLVDPQRDYLMVKEFLRILRREFPTATMYWAEGNHEYRWHTYLSLNAPLIAEMRVGLGMEELFDLRKLKIKWSPRIEVLQVGEISVLHGHEFNGISAQVNAARGLFNKAKNTAVIGHLHQRSTHTEPRLKSKPITTWSVGCLCQLHPDYATINKWSHGVMLIDRTKEETYAQVHNKIILDGQVI